MLEIFPGQQWAHAGIRSCVTQRCASRKRRLPRFIFPAQGFCVGVLALCTGCAVGEADDLVGQDMRRVGGHLAHGHHLHLGIGLESGDEPGALGVDRRPPVVVAVALVEDIGRALGEREALGVGDVVDVGRGDCLIGRQRVVGVVEHVQLEALRIARPGRRRPCVEAAADQGQAGGVEQAHAFLALPSDLPLRGRHQHVHQLFEDCRVAAGAGIGQRRALHGSGIEVVVMAGVGVEAGLQVAKAAGGAKMAEQLRGEQMATGESLHVTIATMARDDAVERAARDGLHHLLESAYAEHVAVSGS